MEKTLYLNENREMRVVRDGPSLWITIGNRAGCRVPARLVSRVVITGNVRLDAGCITLFTENGIPVIFINRRGELLATALGIINPDLRLKERQTCLFANTVYRPRVLNWIKASRKNLQLSLIRYLGYKKGIFSKKGFRERDFKEVISRYLPEDDRCVFIVKGMVSGLLYELLTSIVIRADLDPHLGIIHRRYNMGLVRDLAYIMEAEVLRQTIQFFRLKKWDFYFTRNSNNNAEKDLNPAGVRSVVMRFESHRDRLTNIADGLIDDIFNLMRELRL